MSQPPDGLLWQVPHDLWAGRTVAIAAGGQSLSRSDIEACAAAGAVVIVINRAYQLAPWAEMLFAADVMRTWVDYPAMVDHAGLRVCLWGVNPPPPKQAAICELANRGVKILRHVGQHAGLSDDPSIVRGNNGIHQTLNIAALAGAKRILLLGADLHGGYWHRGHPSCPGRVPNFGPQIGSILTTADPLRRLGIKVFNCTPKSALKCFPILPLDQVLGTKAA